MRRLLVLTGFVALAAVAAGVFVAATRSSANTPAKAATTKPAHHALVVYRHHRGHGSPPARRIGNPRMHFQLVSEGAHGPDVLRLQQLLAKRGYLPVSFQAYGTQPPFELAPRHGRFAWRFHAPAELTSQWQPGVYSTITRGAVMTFEADHGMTIDGVAGRRVWQALVGPRPAAAGALHLRARAGGLAGDDHDLPHRAGAVRLSRQHRHPPGAHRARDVSGVPTLHIDDDAGHEP